MTQAKKITPNKRIKTNRIKVKRPHSQAKEYPDTKVISVRIDTALYYKLKEVVPNTIQDSLREAVLKRIFELLQNDTALPKS